MRCPNCGRKNPEGVRRCRYCGEPMGATKKEKRTLIAGLILIILILAAGIGALYFISRHFGSATGNTGDSTRPSILNEATVTPAPTATPTPTPEPTETPTPEPTPEPVTFTLTQDSEAVNLDGYDLVNVREATATSTIQQQGVNNKPEKMLDGKLKTSWQEGKEDSGIGESVTFYLDGQYNVHCMILHIGHWSSETRFYNNNRPNRMTIKVGSQSFQVEFPDVMREQVLVFSEDIPATEVSLVIDGVDRGEKFDDTCIAEVEIYGY